MNTQTPTLSNSETAFDALKKELRKLGSMSIASDLARPSMGIAVVRAVTDAIPGSDDVERVYGEYMAGRLAAQGKHTLAQGVNEGSEKAQRSKLKQLVDVAKLPLWTNDDNATHLMDRVIGRRGKLIGTDAKIKSPYDAMVDVARAQLKSPAEVIGDDIIDGCLVKPEPAEKGDLDKLIDTYKRAVRDAERMPGNVPLANAVQALSDAIVEAGGEVPPTSKEEKKAAQAMAFMAKMGFTVVRPASQPDAEEAEDADAADATDAAA